MLPAVLPEDVEFLWRQAAIVTPVSGSDLQIGERELSSESTDSRKESDVEIGVSAERLAEALEFSSKEVCNTFFLICVLLARTTVGPVLCREQCQEGKLTVCVCMCAYRSQEN